MAARSKASRELWKNLTLFDITTPPLCQKHPGVTMAENSKPTLRIVPNENFQIAGLGLVRSGLEANKHDTVNNSKTNAESRIGPFQLILRGVIYHL